nr:glutathione S-transferase C-terminal domain-containing protein [Rhizobium tibeticum]
MRHCPNARITKEIRDETLRRQDLVGRIPCPPRVTARLGTFPGAGPQEIADWSRHWIRVGLTAVEELLARRQTDRYAAGDAPSMADICLFPQAVNAERAGLSLDQWPRITAVVARLRAIPAFAENGPAPRT